MSVQELIFLRKFSNLDNSEIASLLFSNPDYYIKNGVLDTLLIYMSYKIICHQIYKMIKGLK